MGATKTCQLDEDYNEGCPDCESHPCVCFETAAHLYKGFNEARDKDD